MEIENSGSRMGGIISDISDDDYDFSEVSSLRRHTPTSTPPRKRARSDDGPELDFPGSEFPAPESYFPVSGFPARDFVDAYGMPVTSGYNPGHTVDPNPFYYPFYSGSTLFRERTPRMRDFPVVRIEGLPLDCTESDLLNFFEGLDIFDCLFVNNNGRFTGQGYVVFFSLKEAFLALQWDCRNMGHRCVRVYASKKSDYYRAVAAEVNFTGYASEKEHSLTPKPRDKMTRIEHKEDEEESLVEMDSTDVLRLRGLPYSVTKADIIQFFGEEFGLREADINYSWPINGRYREAFIKFSSAKKAMKAMKQDMIIGERLVEVSASTGSDHYKAVSSEVKFAGYLSLMEESEPPEPQNMWVYDEQKENKESLEGMHSAEVLQLHGLPNSVTEVLELHGLPNSVTEADMVKLFSEKFHLREDDTKTCFQFDGKAAADAFVKFSSVEMALDTFSNCMWNSEKDEHVGLEIQVTEDPQVLPNLTNLPSMHPLIRKWPVSEDNTATPEQRQN